LPIQDLVPTFRVFSAFRGFSACVLDWFICVADLQQRFRFAADAGKILILWVVLIDPVNGLIVPLASFLFVAQLPVGHRQDKRIRAELLAGTQLFRFIEGPTAAS
jgi:hypothetical protein